MPPLPRRLLPAAVLALLAAPAGAADPGLTLGDPPLVKRTTIGLPAEDDLNFNQHKKAIEWLTEKYAAAVETRRKANRPMIPPAVPVTDGATVFYSGDSGIGAFALKADTREVPPVKVGELIWHHEGWYKPVELAKALGGRYTLDRMVRRADQAPSENVFFHRTLSSAFSLRDGHVHYVDDVAILPPADVFNPQLNGGRPMVFGPFHEGMAENRTAAMEAASGRLVISSSRLEANVRSKLLGMTIILGPPLSAGNRWRIIHERDGKVRVISASWEDLRTWKPKPDPQADWDTELLTAPTPAAKDPHRRLHAVHLVEAGNLILCPTHLGRVIAVEAKTGKVAWAHEYAPVTAKRFETFAPEWVVVPPAVAGGKCVYAPADFAELLCFDVATGKKAWSLKKGDGLYPAVVGERVLVVGEKSVRAVSLADGSALWTADLPGLPCGRGAVYGDWYLVPVSEPKTWRGMIAVVDVKTGKVIQTVKPVKDEPIGNLVVHQEFLISQTLTEIAVFSLGKRE